MTARIAGGTELTIRPAEGAHAREVGGLLTSDAGTPVADGPDFASILGAGIEQANQAQHVAQDKSEALARGASDDLHGTMISMKEADISMKLVGTVRNKLLDAFHELWRINL